MKSSEEILKELKEVAPGLAKLDKSSVGEVPVDYFKSFAVDMMKKIRAEEVAAELSSVAPELARLGKTSVLEAPPAAYFQSVPSSVLQRIKSEEKIKETSPNGWMVSINVFFDRIADSIFKPKYSVAFAGFATMIILAVMMLIKVEDQCKDVDCQMAQISNAELNSYFATHSDEFNTSLLDYTPKEKMPESKVRSVLSDVSDKELNDAILD
ncbi:MAG: hypothetical protein IPP77_11725 [Bacteroidetes bacterium]|nr:hypothetical protein [Bacteroidota bacterium]